MCNAYNHPPGCNCGWGGVNYGNYGWGSIIDRIFSSQRSSSDDLNNAKTFMTKCPWCGDSVYYHTNGYGDSVYFDSLGYPWEVHECFKNYWENKKAFTIYGQSKSKDSDSYLQCDFFTNDVAQQKRLILISSARRIPNVIVGEFLVYKATEEALAKQMGISVEQLRKMYGYGLLYMPETGGIKIFSEQELKIKKKQQKQSQSSIISQAATKKKSPKKTKKSQPLSEIFSVNKSKKKTSQSANQSRQLVLCPYCHQSVRKNRLQKHISQKCKSAPIEQKQKSEKTIEKVKSRKDIKKMAQANDHEGLRLIIAPFDQKRVSGIKMDMNLCCQLILCSGWREYDFQNLLTEVFQRKRIEPYSDTDIEAINLKLSYYVQQIKECSLISSDAKTEKTLLDMANIKDYKGVRAVIAPFDLTDKRNVKISMKLCCQLIKKGWKKEDFENFFAKITQKSDPDQYTEKDIQLINKKLQGYV